MEVIVKKTYEDMSKLAASMIAEEIHYNPRCVLGLATGSTPLGTYKELIRLHKKEKLDFSQVVTFNLDEYVGLKPTHNQSYRCFMNQNLFKGINIRIENTFVPDGMAGNIEAMCSWYEDMIEIHGGIDVQLLGIGGNGHIAFNEPGSSIGGRTRVKTLDAKTIRDNARFFRKLSDVPRYAITMGVGTVLDARQLILLANAESKADAVAAAVEGPLSANCPASAIQLHPMVTVILDKAAAGKLQRKYSSRPAKLPRKLFG